MPNSLNSGDAMLRRLFLLLFVCVGLLITAYDASATARQPNTTEKSVTSTKAAKSQPVGVSKKAASKVSDKSGVAASVKKSSKKQKANVSRKSQSKTFQAKDAESRKYKKFRRDPASLPVIKEEFAETPHSVLTALSTVPVDGDISSMFGMRRISKKTKRVRMHTGVDITAPRGTPVLAAASGEVCYVGRWSAYGKIVEIDHGNGLITRYAHLDQFTVTQGAKVASGAQIGNVGRTGRTTGAHLHFETLVNGRTVDPMLAGLWRQAPGHLAAKGNTYVSGLRASPKPVY